MSILAGNLQNEIDEVIMRSVGIHTLSQRDTSFAVVAVRCNSEKSAGKRKLVPGVVYYLLEGYHIDGDPGDGKHRANINCLYDDYVSTGGNGDVHVQISAIVGQNGSGKSSLIEFVMRLINNFAAMTFGEWKHGESSERLHYIHGLSGDLWYVLEGKMYQLRVENSYVGLFCLGETGEAKKTGRDEREIIFQNGNPNVSGPDNVMPRMGEKDLKTLFNHFFYTLVSNYSLYAYNTNDFKDECDTDEKERLASADTYYADFPAEERCWLHGLFHKNDGYQIPMVITPFRREGNINVNSENGLAKERLISLLVRHEEFRKINTHLVADKLDIRPKDCRSYGLDKISKDLDMQDLTDAGYRSIRKRIIDLWGRALNLDLTDYSYKPLYDLAIDYLVYKTLKIAYTYPQHHEAFRLLSSTGTVFNPGLVEDLVASQIKDMSHITRKIHQTIAYLIYDVFSSEYDAEAHCVKIGLTRIYDLWKTNVFPKFRKAPDFGKNRLATAVMTQSIIPPPFVRTSILLHEIKNKSVRINFETLSSGERQQIYAVSSVLYHLDNLDSVKDDKSDLHRISYRNVLMIFEEVELYFHPELQQQFIKLLLDGIKRYDFKSLKGIHILLVTHSPYVLSDIPKENVLALSNDGMPSDTKLKTFCANIHEMLKDSFFLSHGSQGDFAQWEIGHIMACLKIHQICRDAFFRNDDKAQKKRGEWDGFISEIKTDETNVYAFARRYIPAFARRGESPQFSYEAFCLDFSEEKLRERIGIIDETFVKEILLRELDRVFVKSEHELRQIRIRQLEQELSELRGE